MATTQKSTGEESAVASVASPEVAWYRKQGKHPSRITRDSNDEPYVIGDWAWNRMHPDKQEIIEPRMRQGT